ncbi:SDR family NAD(P)-dependent oxidoreductase [Streptomyces sp. NPDC020490]|uniref:SDR family NAD(P)-dependent oxidoreductase n=1 Tax=Streptomyces sp. NPDC020490 TaxID=3365078 RepID=UPI00379BE1D7
MTSPLVAGLTGKTALVTGAARGIGLETALMLAENGAKHVILLDLDPAGVQRAAGAVRDRGAAATAVAVDLADRTELRVALSASLRDAGSLDIVVNNAGICDENAPDDLDTWLHVMDVNLTGAFAVTACCLGRIGDGGRIVNVSSVLGKLGNLRNTAYSASKHGLLGYTKSLALDLAPRRITVNAVLPGRVDTPMMSRELGVLASRIGSDVERVVRNARREVPLRRLIEPAEVAGLIAFLASDNAAAITGQSFTIDAGFTRGA